MTNRTNPWNIYCCKNRARCYTCYIKRANNRKFRRQIFRKEQEL